jgi:tetratricopeptide (TPR) repeat protein
LDGEYEKAEEYARKAIEFSPGNPMPHNILGAIYHRQGKNELALQEVLTGERLSSKEDLQRFLGTYLGIGDIYAELKKYDKAIEYYRKVLSSHEGNLLAREGLAKVYVNMHRTDLAIEQYRILEKSESEYFQKQGAEGIKRLKGSPSEK